MSESELVPAREALTTPRFRSRGKSEHSGRERRRMPRPRLAEIKRGAKLKLMPPIVVTGAVRMIEFVPSISVTSSTRASAHI